MLAIGRGLMAKPALLLLDEPSLGLAPLIVADVMQTIARVAREGVTVLLVEQNAHLALQILDPRTCWKADASCLAGKRATFWRAMKCAVPTLGVRSESSEPARSR